MFERIYGSPWQHPGIAFIAAVPFLILFASRQRFLVAWTTIFLFEIVADAMVTGGFAPVRDAGLAQGLAIAFVILGNLRYFLLVEVFLRSRGNPTGLASPMAWVVATILAFVVPVGSFIPQKVWPDLFADPRKIFLLYEAMFFVLALFMRFIVLPRRALGLDPAMRRWIFRLTTFVIVQYGLWATADVVILAGIDAGFLLRIVPNALYYGAFVPFAYLSAPGTAKAS